MAAPCQTRFLHCRGFNVGKSVFEPGMEKVVAEIYDLAASKVGVENVDDFLVLPIDVAVAPEISKDFLVKKLILIK